MRHSTQTLTLQVHLNLKQQPNMFYKRDHFIYIISWLLSDNEESTISPNDVRTMTTTIATMFTTTYILSGFISMSFVLLLTALSIILWQKSSTKSCTSRQDIEYYEVQIYEKVIDTVETGMAASRP